MVSTTTIKIVGGIAIVSLVYFLTLNPRSSRTPVGRQQRVGAADLEDLGSGVQAGGGGGHSSLQKRAAASSAHHGPPGFVATRAVGIWVFRENNDIVEVLLLPSAGQPLAGQEEGQKGLDVVEGAVRFVESPSKAAHRVLQDKLGLRPQDYQFLENVVDGPRGKRWKDVHTYVALVLPRMSDAAQKRAPSGRFVTIKSITAGAYKKDVEAGYATDMLDDLPFVHKWLQPFILTAGKDPVQCTGSPPGWGPAAILKAKMAWPHHRSAKAAEGGHH